MFYLRKEKSVERSAKFILKLCSINDRGCIEANCSIATV